MALKRDTYSPLAVKANSTNGETHFNLLWEWGSKRVQQQQQNGVVQWLKTKNTSLGTIYRKSSFCSHQMKIWQIFTGLFRFGKLYNIGVVGGEQIFGQTRRQRRRRHQWRRKLRLRQVRLRWRGGGWLPRWQWQHIRLDLIRNFADIGPFHLINVCLEQPSFLCASKSTKSGLFVTFTMACSIVENDRVYHLWQ